MGFRFPPDIVRNAATAGQAEVLKYLSSRAKVDRHTYWQKVAELYNASKTGDTIKLYQLIQENVEPDLQNYRGVTPL